MSDNTHPIHVSCPVCEESFDVPASFKGQKIECPICLSPISTTQGSLTTTKTADRTNTENNFAKLPIDIKKDNDAQPDSIINSTRSMQKTMVTASLEDQSTSEVSKDTSSEANISDNKLNSTVHPKDSNKTAENLTIGESGSVQKTVTTKPSGKPKSWASLLIIVISILMLIGAGFLYGIGLHFSSKIGQVYNIASKFIDNEFSQIGGVSKLTNEQIETMKNILSTRSDQINRTKLFLKESKIVSDEEIEQIKQMLVAYSEETDQEKKLEFLGDTNQLKNDIKSWNLNDLNKKISIYNIINEYILNPNVVLLKFEINGDPGQAIFVKNKNDKKWLLDWYSISGFSSFPYEKLISTKPNEPIEIRAIARMDSQYSKDFAETPSTDSYNNKAYLSVNLELPGGQSINGYIDRLNPDALELIKGLKHGGVKVLLSIHYPKDLINNDSVIISKLHHIGWHSKETEEMLQKSATKEQ